MIHAGIEVELCKVLDPNDEVEKAKKGKKKASSRTPAKKRKIYVVESESEPEILVNDQPMGSVHETDDEDVLPTLNTSLTARAPKKKRRKPSPEL
jgi:hypothetical protein